MEGHNERSDPPANTTHTGTRSLLWTILKILLVPATMLMVWKTMALATGSRYPIVVVISESMEPAFSRGDLLLLWNHKHHVEVGDIPVCWFVGNPLPMVHRAISNVYIESESNPGVFLFVLLPQKPGSIADRARQHILTKGDNNQLDDTAMYSPGQSRVLREEVVGLVRGYVPYLGWITIALNDHPWLKVVGALAVTICGIWG